MTVQYSLQPLEIDQAAYRAWLAGHTADESVGTSVHPESCPIARYLRHRGDNYLITATYARSVATDERFALPAWVCDHILSLDNSAGIFRPITAAVALAALGGGAG